MIGRIYVFSLNSTLEMERFMENETWVEADNYPGYEVSSLGRVRSWRVRNNNQNSRSLSPRILRPASASRGRYHRYCLCSNGVGRAVLAHQLVLRSFAGPPQDGKRHALHRNDIGTDNRIENLYWGNDLDNSRDRSLNGRQVRARGSRAGHAKLAEDSVSQIKSRLRSGEKPQDIAAAFGVTYGCIWFIQNGKSWKHV